MGLKDLCERIHEVYREDERAEGAAGDVHRRCPRWRCGRPMPTTGWSTGKVESVEIDNLMGRTLAVMVVPYPPGIPLIMPGERITPATKSIQDYLLYARELRPQVPGLRDRHPRPALRAGEGGRRYLVDCVIEEGDRMIPRDVKAPTVAIPFHKLLKVVAIVDRDERADQGAARPDRRARTSKSRCATASTATSPRMPRSAPISARSTASASRRPASFVRAVRALGFRTPLWALADSRGISDIAVARA